MLKCKLEYEWAHVYRTLLSRDLDQKEYVSASDFKAALLRTGIYLDKESWATIFKHFGSGDNINYKEMSLALGLHKGAVQNMSSARLSQFLTKLHKPRTRSLNPLSRSVSSSLTEASGLAPGGSSSAAAVIFNPAIKHKSLLRRLFKNFDQANDNQVSQHDFVNITSKMGMQLSKKVGPALTFHSKSKRLQKMPAQLPAARNSYPPAPKR